MLTRKHRQHLETFKYKGEREAFGVVEFYFTDGEKESGSYFRAYHWINGIAQEVGEQRESLTQAQADVVQMYGEPNNA